jgi:hypothetical protein
VSTGGRFVAILLVLALLVPIAAVALAEGSISQPWAIGVALLVIVAWRLAQGNGSSEDLRKDVGQSLYSGPKFWEVGTRAPAPKVEAPEPEVTEAPKRMRHTHLSGYVPEPGTEEPYAF